MYMTEENETISRVDHLVWLLLRHRLLETLPLGRRWNQLRSIILDTAGCVIATFLQQFLLIREILVSKCNPAGFENSPKAVICGLLPLSV
jgi:hypothetical protein